MDLLSGASALFSAGVAVAGHRADRKANRQNPVAPKDIASTASHFRGDPASQGSVAVQVVDDLHGDAA